MGVIYMLSWTNNPYFYIGQTQEHKKRKSNHISALQRKTHPNPKLQAIFNKYKAPNFHILEEITIDKLNEREQFYLDLLFDQPECLNLAKDAVIAARGYRHSNAAKEKIAKARKGKAMYIKPVLQYSKDGVFIKEWSSIVMAARELKINDGNISSCCKTYRKAAGGFVWKYKTMKANAYD